MRRCARKLRPMGDKHTRRFGFSARNTPDNRNNLDQGKLRATYTPMKAILLHKLILGTTWSLLRLNRPRILRRGRYLETAGRRALIEDYYKF